jgi:hypothetical protein
MPVLCEGTRGMTRQRGIVQASRATGWRRIEYSVTFRVPEVSCKRARPQLRPGLHSCKMPLSERGSRKAIEHW